MKYLFPILFFVLLHSQNYAQDIYYTKTAHITFDSSTPLETIHADNKQVTSFIKLSSGDINFAALIRSFQFPNALMEEHFNENFIESDKYPKAIFKGKILNIDLIHFTSEQVQFAEIIGTIELHGVKKGIKTIAEIRNDGKYLIASTDFIVTPGDFNIKIPSPVRNKIAKEVKVSVVVHYKPYKK